MVPVFHRLKVFKNNPRWPDNHECWLEKLGYRATLVKINLTNRPKLTYKHLLKGIAFPS